MTDLLIKYNLPVEILEFIVKDTDGNVYYDLENIEKLLDNGATSYSDLLIYDKIVEIISTGAENDNNT